MSSDPQDLYKMLEQAYAWASQICDPVDYKYRQQQLLRTLAHFLLQIHKPVVNEEIPPKASENEQPAV